jgi:DNA-binding NarL/FixJ family response regulator
MHDSKKNLQVVNIMIIEDDEVYRESILDLINESDNLHCEHACISCEEALEILKKGFAPQIILLDIELPGMSGLEGIKEIKKITPSSEIIILTVFDEDDKIFSAICQGASGYLLKSVSSKNIQNFIMDVVSGGAVMNPSIAAKILKMFNRESEPQEEYGLTTRENEILKLLVDGYTKKHIADELYISFLTVDTHVKNIYNKLHVHSQVDVVIKAMKERLI